MKQIKILSTRKLDPSIHERAEQENFMLIEENLIRTHFKKDKETVEKVFEALDQGLKDLVFTSSNAVRALELIIKQENRELKWKNIFCLSGRTREAVLKSFIENHIGAEGRNAEELAAAITTSEAKEVIFFCGNKRRDTLPSVLTAAGIKCMEVEVYETEESPKRMDDDFDAILFFSPSAVTSFFRYNQLTEETVCFSIGETTADSLKEQGIKNIITSPFPQEEKIFETLINHFKKLENRDR
jgi:uroporphyrinogen-III synthase